MVKKINDVITEEQKNCTHVWVALTGGDRYHIAGELFEEPEANYICGKCFVLKKDLEANIEKEIPF